MNRRKTLIIAVVILLIITGAGIGYSLFDRNHHLNGEINGENGDDYHLLETTDGTYRYNSDLSMILIMGIDSKNEELKGQSDHMSLLIFDRGTKEYTMLNLPRETMTKIRVYTKEGDDWGYDTNFLGLAYPNGTHVGRGALNAMEAVSMLLGDIPIISYLAADLTVLPKMAEFAGDADLILEDDSLTYLNEEWVAGAHYVVNKDTIEIFLRSRNINADFSNTQRVGRQNLYLRWYFERIKELSNRNIESVLKKLEDVLQFCDTNLTLEEADSYLQMLNEYKAAEPLVHGLSGRYAKGTRHEEFYPNEDDLQTLIINLFYKKD